jgi:hypothetical protein
MRRNLHWSVQLAVLLGLIGLFVTQVSFWLGVLMILVGLAVPILAFQQSRTKSGSSPSLPFGDLLRRSAPSSAKPKAVIKTNRKAASPQPGPAHRSIDRRKLGVLRFTLHQAGLDSNAPVFHTSEDKAVTVSDILVEMIAISDSLGRPIEELAVDIATIYPRIFDHTPLALRQYPDEDLAKAYIARKAMTGLGWKLDM